MAIGFGSGFFSERPDDVDDDNPFVENLAGIFFDVDFAVEPPPQETARRAQGFVFNVRTQKWDPIVVDGEDYRFL